MYFFNIYDHKNLTFVYCHNNNNNNNNNNNKTIIYSANGSQLIRNSNIKNDKANIYLFI